MNLNDYEMRGRAVVQHFMTELEKIALSPATMARAVHKSQQQLAETKGLLGMKRFLPGSAERQAWLAAKKKSKALQSGANERMLQKRRDALQLMASQRASDQAAGRAALKGLGEVNAPTSGLQAARRRAGLGGGQVQAPPESSLSPTARKALTGAGLAGLGAAGLYTGQQYLANQQQGYGGY